MINIKENIFYVYLHRRKDNNEVFYVGKGKDKRATSIQGRNKWWHNIINKAGGFDVEYVEKELSDFSAQNLEIELIKFYRDNGHILCNLTDGGEGSAGRMVSDETKAKLSSANMGHKKSEETKYKLSISHKGKKMSDEARRKMSNNRRNKLSVLCSNGMIFDSGTAAEKWLLSIGFKTASASNIIRSCKNEQRTAYGFTWTFAHSKILKEEV